MIRDRDGTIRQAAAVPFRVTPALGTEVLLIRRRNGGWSIPKGLVDPGHTVRAAAATEALEEAGVEGELSADVLGTFEHAKFGGTCRVEVFALHVTSVHEHYDEERVRERRWFAQTEAVRVAKRPDVAAIIARLDASTVSTAPHPVGSKPAPLVHAARRARGLLGRLRPEEGLLVLGFVASAILTIYANVDLYQQGIRSRAIRGGLLRLAVVILFAAGLPLLERALRRGDERPRLLATAVFLRTMLPFLMCIAVYTNLHDTVRYVNSHDVHAYIAAVEQWMFGGQPVLWAERYVTPARTDFFNFFYANFYLVAPSVFLVLWFSGRHDEARRALLGIVLCFYSGYVLYVLLPAAPPRLYFASLGLFTKSLRGGPITHFQEALIGMMPNHAARAAFPSLHAAVSCLSLYYSWKYCRWFLPILLVFVIGLLVSTVYLRHHWVVDLIAGALLVPWVLWLTPRFERFWARHVERRA